jgi:hypothetical protein
VAEVLISYASSTSWAPVVNSGNTRFIETSSIIKIASSFIPSLAMCVLQPLALHRLTSMEQECMVGLAFPAESDARNFHKQVVGRKGVKSTLST